MEDNEELRDEHARHQRVLARFLNLRDDDEDSLVNRVILSLAQDIIEGVIAPGETFNSLELSKRFESSRTPIREALFALEREGLIEVPPRRRPRVAAPTSAQVVEIYELRAVLHAMVARKVARNASADDLATLRLLLDSMESAVDAGSVDDYFWSNVEFHAASLQIAGDFTLGKVLDGLGLQVLRLRRRGMSEPGRLRRSVDDHERLLVAYLEQDEELAGVLSSSIILAGLRALQNAAHLDAPR